MWTVEYYWERVFQTRHEAEEFALTVGPVYDVIPRAVEIRS